MQLSLGASCRAWPAHATLARHDRQAPGRRCKPAPAAARPDAQREGLGTQLRELLGHTGDDPGHWNHSPEWWGSQGGGWGRSPGGTAFDEQSELNGRVTVTSHEASCSSSISSGGLDAAGSERKEWRVLRFNDTTRQSVSLVTLQRFPSGSSNNGSRRADVPLPVADPTCLAQPYLKSAAALVAALLGLHRLLPCTSGTSGGSGEAAMAVRPLRVLCLGLGGGSLPLFLAHNFPQAVVDAVEIDPVVVCAAVGAMGLPAALPNLRLHTADAARFVADATTGAASPPAAGAAGGSEGGGEGRWYDLVAMDVFDGKDEVPAALRTPEFAAQLAALLHPAHGSLVLNVHSVDWRPLVAVLSGALLAPQQGGAAIAGAASTQPGREKGAPGGAGGGAAFAVSVPRQLNVQVVLSRGLALPSDPAKARTALSGMAAYVASEAGYRFPAGKRAANGYQRL